MMKSINVNYLLLVVLLLSDALAETDTSVSPMLATEREALYSLMRALIGSEFNVSELYPDPCGWTPIQGISCDLFDGFWYVTAVSIGPIHDNSPECSQNAQFSDCIFEFRHLKSLYFFNCFHRPITIPSQNWEKLAGCLETLELRSNPGVTGGIPTGIASLKNLLSLVLVENGLTGELQVTLGNLSKLKRLVLAENQFSGQIPSSLGGLSELLILDLSRNSLSGSLPSTFGSLASLLKLDLSNNFLEGKIPIELGRLRNLTLLDLRYNKFSAELPQSLQDMVSLEEMLLGNNPTGGNLMESGWWRLKNLNTLDLSNMSLTGSIPESMVEIRRLRFLALDNNRLSGRLSSKLSSLPGLNALHLSRNNLSGMLEFSEKFYVKMGRRFSVWNNPYLCYPVGLVHVPLGVEQCDKEAASVLKTEVGGGNSNEEGKSSLEFSGSAVGGFWIDRLMEKMVVFVLFVFAIIDH